MRGRVYCLTQVCIWNSCFWISVQPAPVRRLSSMQSHTVFTNPLAICIRCVALAMRNTDMWRRPEPRRASDFVRANARSNTHPPLPVSRQVRWQKLCEPNARPRHDYVSNRHGAPKNLQARPALDNYGVPDSEIFQWISNGFSMELGRVFYFCPRETI